MRISDWSSDVCSSDLLPHLDGREALQRPVAVAQDHGILLVRQIAEEERLARAAIVARVKREHIGLHGCVERLDPLHSSAQRSEEHTSELQSLMRTSYAVFCLKKKTNKKHRHPLTTEQ